MFDFMKSNQTIQREQLRQHLTQMMKQRMMSELGQAEPNSVMAPSTFEEALGKGKFDDPNLTRILDMIRRRHAPPESSDRAGGGSFSSGMSMGGLM